MSEAKTKSEAKPPAQEFVVSCVPSLAKVSPPAAGGVPPTSITECITSFLDTRNFHTSAECREPDCCAATVGLKHFRA